MSTWEKNKTNSIVVTSELDNLVLKAFYKKTDELDFKQMAGVFERSNDGKLYVLNTSFSEEGDYIIQIIDESYQLKDLHAKITVNNIIEKIDSIKNTQDIITTLLNDVPLLRDIRDELINVTYGGLEISNNQLTIKDKEGSIIAIFDLFDQNGKPTMLSVFKREVVQ